MSTIRLRPGDDVLRAVYAGVEATETVGVVTLWAGTPDRYRGVAVTISCSQITLIEGGPAVTHRWQDSLGALRDVLMAAGDLAAYGYIKRGQRPSYAVFHRSLAYDWVWREDVHVNEFVKIALEPCYAPDAFGIQLLGPGYADRIPTGPDWQTTPLDGGSVLLEHVDPAAWYALMFETVVPKGRPTKDNSPPVPSVVTFARHDLADIILTEQIAYPNGRSRPNT
jgi:hypothetical protein